MKKKILSEFIALTLAVSTLTVPVFAQTESISDVDTQTDSVVQAEEPAEQEAAELVIESEEPAEQEEAEEIAPGMMLLGAEVSPTPKLRSMRAANTVSMPITLAYNIVNVFNDDNTYNGGNAYGGGAGGTIYATSFKENTDIAWKTPWTTGMEENTLTANGVDFTLRVVAGKEELGGFMSKSTNCDTDGKWSTIDVTDAKYESIDFLINVTANDAKWGTTSIKLNYTDGTSTISEFKSINKLDGAQPADAVGIISVDARIMGADKTGKIAHYSVPADNQKVLNNVQVLGYHYNITEFNQDGTVKTYENIGNSAGTGAKAALIYAMTAVMSKAEYSIIAAGKLDEKIVALIAQPFNRAAAEGLKAEIDAAVLDGVNVNDITYYNDLLAFINENAPAQMQIDLSSYYNVVNIFNNDPAYDGGNAHGDGSGGSIYADKNKINPDLAWRNAWQDGMTENILTVNGVDFKMKIAAGAEKSGFSSLASACDTDGKWATIDFENMKYESIDFLANFALASATWGTTSFKLNYTDGTYSIVEYKNIKKLSAEAPSSDAVGSVLFDARLQAVDRKALISHYRIPVNNQKILDNIQVLGYHYDITLEEDGTIKSYTNINNSAGTGARATIIYSLTATTTVKEYSVWAATAATELDTKLSAEITEDAGQITALSDNGVALYKELGRVIDNAGLDPQNYPNYAKIKSAMPEFSAGSFTTKDGLITATLTFTKAMADLTDKITVTYNGEEIENVGINQESDIATLTLVDRFDDSNNYEIIIDASAYAEIGTAFNLGTNATYSFRTTGNMGPVPTPSLTAPVANVATFTTRLQNTSGTPKSYYILIYAYAADGKLVGANFATGTLTDAIPVDISKPVNAEEAVSYKAIFMDNIETMKTIYTTYIQ